MPANWPTESGDWTGVNALVAPEIVCGVAGAVGDPEAEITEGQDGVRDMR
ncbi:hypothetical protein ABZ362_19895 [Streptomyces sp. NPDC005951]